MSKPDPSDRTKGSGPDDLALSLRGVGRGSRTDSLTDQLRDAIRTMTVAPGDRLPPTRVLAEQLEVSRGVISEAYARLASEGLVQGAGRGGTVVQQRGEREPGDVATAPPRLITADSVAVLRPPRSNEGFERLRDLPARVDLTPGQPDLSAFPRAAWIRAERHVLNGEAASELGYGDPQGHPRLRSSVARWLTRTRGISANPDDIVIVAGVAQSLFLLAQVLRRDGQSRIAVEDPGSRGARQQLEAWGLDCVPVPVDESGVCVDQLAEGDARTVMVTPAHQFPTGVSLSGPRRSALLSWAEDRGGLIVEDDYDAEHRYDRHPTAALAATAPSLVYYAGSVSKLLAPALRIGWAIPPAQIRDDIVALKRETDLGNPTLAQLALSQMLDRGDFARHLRVVRKRHRTRRDALLLGLAEYAPPAAILGIAAGLHLTLRLPDGVDEMVVAIELVDRHGIKTQPLSWHRHATGAPGLVLSYASSPPAVLRDAGRTIGQLCFGGRSRP